MVSIIRPIVSNNITPCPVLVTLNNPVMQKNPKLQGVQFAHEKKCKNVQGKAAPSPPIETMLTGKVGFLCSLIIAASQVGATRSFGLRYWKGVASYLKNYSGLCAAQYAGLLLIPFEGLSHHPRLLGPRKGLLCIFFFFKSWKNPKKNKK